MSARSAFAWIAAAVAIAALAVALLGPGRRLVGAIVPAPADLARAVGSPSLVGRRLPSLAGAHTWIGGRAPQADSMAGRPLLVLVWSATQPASLRAARLAELWRRIYAPWGLQVIGVHVPQFSFAADSAQVGAVMRGLGVGFAVAHDPALELANAFGPRATPRFLLTDAARHVIADVSTPDSAEAAARAWLAERPPHLPLPPGPIAEPVPAGPATVFMGSTHVVSGPLAGVSGSEPQRFTPILKREIEGDPYTPYPAGMWSLSADGLTAARGGAENFVALRYDGAPLGAVISPPAGGEARVWILRDERWLGEAELGADVRLDGHGASYVLVDRPGWYALCRSGPGEHVVKLSPESPGVVLHAFTFEASEISPE